LTRYFPCEKLSLFEIDNLKETKTVTKQYSDKGDELCNPPVGHEFEEGLCVHCGAPETPADTDKAISNFYAEEDKRLAEKATQKER
jgi:hypothetical protein